MNSLRGLFHFPKRIVSRVISIAPVVVKRLGNLEKKRKRTAIISSLNSTQQQHFLGIDSMAMSPILNKNDNGPWVFDPSGDSGAQFEVYGYQGKSESKEILEEGTFVTTYDFPNATSILLVVNRALGRDDQERSLISPFVMRAAGLIVHDTAVQHASLDIEEPHAIIVPDRKYTLQLDLMNTQSVLKIRRPTEEELQTLERVELTLPAEWNPFDPHYDDLERIAVKRKNEPIPWYSLKSRTLGSVITGRCVSAAVTNSTQNIHDFYQQNFSESTRVINDVLPALHALHFSDRVIGEINVASVDIGATSSRRFPGVTSQHISNIWHIGLKTAERTREATYSKGVTRNNLTHGLLGRKLRTQHQQIDLPRTRAKVYADHMQNQTVGVGGITGAMIFTTAYHFTDAYALRNMTGSESANALKDFIRNIGIPEKLVHDGHKSLTGTEWSNVCRDRRIKQLLTEPYSHWHNMAEAGIRELKRLYKKFMHQCPLIPNKYWFYLLRYCCDIRNRTALNIYSLEGRTPYEKMTGAVPDIDPYVLFRYGEPIFFNFEKASGTTREFPPHQLKEIGRWLGVSRNDSTVCTYFILTISGNVLSRSDAIPWTADERKDRSWLTLLQQFDEAQQNNNADIAVAEEDKAVYNNFHLQDFIEKDRGISVHPNAIDPVDGDNQFNSDAMAQDDLIDVPFDEYVGSYVRVPHKGEDAVVRILNKQSPHDGKLNGTESIYTAQMPDGEIKAYTENVVASNLFAQADDDGNAVRLVDEIIDHYVEPYATPIGEDTYTDTNGRTHTRRNFKGWSLLIRWKDENVEWIPLRYMYDSEPLITAEYAVNNKLTEWPAFKWWVEEALLARQRQISALTSGYWTRTEKFGLPLPKSVAQCKEIDDESSKSGQPRLWKLAIEKEMKAVMIAFDFRGHTRPVGFKEIKCHLIFDIKMDFTHKARFVAGGHMATPDPNVPIYASVVTRESVRILLTVASLNNLALKAADISNAFLTAKCDERICFRAGPEFGDKQGQWVVVVRALYGLVSASASFARHRNNVLTNMGFTPCQADPDVWMRRNLRKSAIAREQAKFLDKTNSRKSSATNIFTSRDEALHANNYSDSDYYYEYICTYVDDILAISEDPDAIMKTISDTFTLKDVKGTGEKWETPTAYLGADIGLYRNNKIWCMGAQTYIDGALKTVQNKLKTKNLILQKAAKEPLPWYIDPKNPCKYEYRPDLDVSDFLDKNDSNWFQQLIGILNWIVELGRIDIHNLVARLSAYLAAPRVGHLKAALHIFSYLKGSNNKLIEFDPEMPELPQNFLDHSNWTEFYPDAAEINELPSKMPQPLGNPVRVTCFVDADHAGDRATRRSYTGIIMMINKAFVSSFSKRQNTVEAASFGSEIIAARIAKEKIQALTYKLRMLGIPIAGPACMYVDNDSVVKSVSTPESKLKKKHLSICYHAVREAIAANVMKVCWISSKDNLADLCTKILHGKTLHDLIDRIMVDYNFTTLKKKMMSKLNLQL